MVRHSFRGFSAVTRRNPTFAFDLLSFDGRELRGLALLERKPLL
jgi:ATP-dependent DNA ligase